VRNLAFLAAGLGLLLVQANMFRVLDPLRVGAVVVAWLLALALDVWLMVREARAVPASSRAVTVFRGYASLPLTVLLAYAIVGSVTGARLPAPIPALVLPLILFMGVHEYSLARGAAVAFVLGYATDVFGIAPIGLYTFTYTATFVLARTAGVRLAAQTMWMQAVLVLAFAIVHSAMILVLLAIFGRERDAWVPRSLYPLALPHAIATAAVAPVVFHIAQAIHAATGSAPRPEAGGGRA
jgi:rod shape-determining protein MreD